MNTNRYARPRHSFAAASPRNTLAAAVLVAVLAVTAVACGGGSSAGGPASDELLAQGNEGEVDPGMATTDPEVATSSASITTGEGQASEGSEEVERPSSGWDGPDVLPLAEAAVARLAAPIGQRYSAEAVAEVFAMPGDFVDVEGTILGLVEEWDLDTRDGDVAQEMIVGTDTVITQEELVNLASEIGADETFPWRTASTSDGGTIITALFTSRTDPDPVRRLVLQSYLEPDAATAPMNWELEISTHTEVVAPDWVAGLPIPEGGVLIRHTTGVGQVKSFATTPGDGLVSVTYEYPVDALAELEAYFATDVLEQAGFSFEDTPFNNQRVRIDLSIEDWSGSVSVWEGSSSGVVTRYGVTWTLSK